VWYDEEQEMKRPITLILAETALETIPPSILTHPAVQASANRKNKPADQILLDTALHHHAMRSLLEHPKRGRPDITHICLLMATGSPLYRENLLNIIIHTRNGQLILVNPDLQWRPPKNYNRFCGLIEQLFASSRKCVPQTGVPLLSLMEGPLSHVRAQLDSPILLFTKTGEYSPLSRIIKNVFQMTDPKTLTLIVGAFPKGTFSPETIAIADHQVSISKHSLEAWTVVSRGIYEIEKYLLE